MNPLIVLAFIATLESGGIADAVGQGGDIGLYQVTPICLQNFNQFHKIKYSMDDMFNVNKATVVATWTLHKRIPQMLKHFNLPVTEENVIRCWNAGIKTVKDGTYPEITKKYVRNYKAMKSTSIKGGKNGKNRKR